MNDTVGICNSQWRVLANAIQLEAKNEIPCVRKGHEECGKKYVAVMQGEEA